MRTYQTYALRWFLTCLVVIAGYVMLIAFVSRFAPDMSAVFDDGFIIFLAPFLTLYANGAGNGLTETLGNLLIAIALSAAVYSLILAGASYVIKLVRKSWRPKIKKNYEVVAIGILAAGLIACAFFLIVFLVLSVSPLA